MSEMVRQCERDVEQARAKFAQDLATLRSPDTFSSFTDDLKQEAADTKDAIVEKARSTAESVAARLFRDVKAKVAANPAAALAIGAGIGWRLVRNPPIATALVGAGLYSLWNTHAAARGETDAELMQRGKQRLQEQVSAMTSSAKDVASEMGQAAVTKVTEAVDIAATNASQTAEGAREKVGGWTDQGRAMAHDARAAAKEHAAQAGRSVRGAARETWNEAYQR